MMTRISHGARSGGPYQARAPGLVRGPEPPARARRRPARARAASVDPAGQLQLFAPASHGGRRRAPARDPDDSDQVTRAGLAAARDGAVYQASTGSQAGTGKSSLRS